MNKGQTLEIRYSVKDGVPHTLLVITRKKTAISVIVDHKMLFEKRHIKWRHRLPLIGRWLLRRKETRMQMTHCAFDGCIDCVTIGEVGGEDE